MFLYQIDDRSADKFVYEVMSLLWEHFCRNNPYLVGTIVNVRNFN